MHTSHQDEDSDSIWQRSPPSSVSPFIQLIASDIVHIICVFWHRFFTELGFWCVKVEVIHKNHDRHIVYCFKYTLRKNEFIHAFLSSSAMYEYHDNWMLWRDDIGLAECKSQHSKRYNYYNILQRIWRPSTYYSWGRMFIGSRIPLMRLQPKTGVPCCNIPAL